MYNPFISIIIPCRNEEKFIGMCLDSIIDNDYPKENLEILVIDGMSEDGTRKILNEYTQKYAFIRTLDNPKKITPCALNIGIKNAKSGVIIRMDAHATYQNDYISKCVKNLYEYNADNVGGVWKIVPRNNTLIGKGIVQAISHPFGIGKSRHRFVPKEPVNADTVPYFCCRKELFKQIGLFNENLSRGQDLEFNIRIKKAGGKILLMPDIVIYYYARSALNKSFCKFYFGEGFWAIYPVKFVGRDFLSLWRLVPCVFVLSLIFTGILSVFFPFLKWLFLFIVGSYFLCSQYVSIKVAIKRKDSRYIFVMPVIFATIHIFYGMGSLWGLFKLFLPKRRVSLCL